MGLTALMGVESASFLIELKPSQVRNVATLAPADNAVVTSGLAKKSPPLLAPRACEPPLAEGAGLGRAEEEVLILAGRLTFGF